ncbi:MULTISPECIES: phosphatidylglycerophosphatase A [Aneurinibacillus]|jgi:phosphatidylglycerophosphatase A|uniref:Phosphatidylglycerophosphatase A n=1 Tax=Aneurinibacillus thermoaerophilus TaxID=143495 RepID=A0A1G8BYD6_ANETH|nr:MULTISPECIES: phosphatidylglycerophosphatase A [Aneurinibacillus]AMA71980.1 phosphatidylglycerophosphatase [Aneurinibacillus sp. XH2]MED0675110.1 phosphatidylglycerophosphatase A [Aneurinibacillus thermoaerophilus]MED0679259.1 phosphatidylglycerophosphatase A [Aneurinibacillus thermoaerophilus]MED0737145.1 phosphatidylglycerophosphatase A [Aneurinibacillus thermoaerophilus]MED0757191.1 phosphatidylglycerophosphatase A [Aneurinibacillus thermoaerophilus]
MSNMEHAVHDKKVRETAYRLLKERGVTMEHLVELVMFLQKDYFSDLTTEMCEYNIRKVLEKREIQNAIITGIQLDILAEKGLLMEPLQEMLAHDEGLYGIDEILALSIVNVYGSIGFTNYGYVDKVKPGILKKLNKTEKEKGEVHTFLDDIVGAIAAAASSRLAHSRFGTK